MLVLRSTEMAAVDKEAIELGYPEIILMETAGRSVAREIDTLDELDNQSDIYFLIGGGNNGGDGLVAARYLKEWGYKNLKVFLLKPGENLSGINRDNYNICRLQDVEMEVIDSEKLNEFRKILNNADIIIDGLLGTGITGDARGLAADLIGIVNDISVNVLAIDIPSGLSLDFKSETVIRADLTVTLADLKIAQAVYPGRYYCGEIIIADIGMPAKAYRKIRPDYFMLSNQEAARFLPYRTETGHKGTFGKVLIIGGSAGMAGSVSLAGEAALKMGAGMVTIALPAAIEHDVNSHSREIITEALPDENGKISLKALDKIINISNKMDLVILGPGLGQGKEIAELVENLLKKLKPPIILDADGINTVRDLEQLDKSQKKILLTPHPGEMARLYDTTIPEILENRFDYIKDFVEKTGQAIILKGADSLIGLSEGEIFINPTGNDGMATAGSGDVLAGIAGGLVAQGLDLEKAGIVASFIHGRAGDLAAEDKNRYSLVAGDLIVYLAEAINSIIK
ncbi:NAD(P)H-hydrate dehydratase [Halanaerobiaceae bacterium Z-7014]|uniref:Bifunctional NAD(P)H-hydrate repair enzyme n=1 Tax=Halonatronomonas betaini TaxID=2778430 RepID=A0A931F8R7_9FIRM|nr:NAD(P)H-hydrate dehydratase [Halonatronomonas betaini]MBF8438056.1 NAD(P)H-hydrate dehydratase [Halonatronomonas betaini]